MIKSFFPFLFLLFNNLSESNKSLLNDFYFKDSTKLRKAQIKWVSGLSWDQIQALALKDGKGIFIDCYATWCFPCKKMDAEVFSNDTVCELINKNYVAVKIQFDSTTQHDEDLSKGYAIAKKIKDEYNIYAMPTFLFFSADGNISHKVIGAKSTKDFIEAIQDAGTPSKQYYGLMRSFYSKNMEYYKMPSFAEKAAAFKDNKVSMDVAREYMVRYIYQLPYDSIINKENLLFMSTFFGIITTSDPIFDVYLHKSEAVDSILGVGHSRSMIDNIISKQVIQPAIDEAKNKQVTPRWNKIFVIVKKQYGEDRANRIVTLAKGAYHFERKEFNKFTKSVVELVEASKLCLDTTQETARLLNHYAWGVFLYSKNMIELKRAIVWVDRAIAIEKMPKRTAPYLDTKANILYKIGKKNEGIMLEKKALQLAPTSKSLQKNYEKMKNNEPTWKSGDL